MVEIKLQLTPQKVVGLMENEIINKKEAQAYLMEFKKADLIQAFISSASYDDEDEDIKKVGDEENEDEDEDQRTPPPPPPPPMKKKEKQRQEPEDEDEDEFNLLDDDD